MKRAILGALVISLGILIKSCDTTDPPDNKSLTLKLEDVSCTEAWIELTTTNLQLPTTITLKQTNPTGDTKSQIINLNIKDSLLYIDSLLPNKSYTFIASHSSASGGLSGITSNTLSVTTMDTTSHDFTWQSWTFGTIGSSTLYDVAIINENNIWAVGEILIADTSINGYTTYNAVHWDGSQWNLKKITVTFRGNLITPPLEGVFAFSTEDIWFVGSLPIHGDGENWIMYDLRTTLDPNISLSKAWGISSNNIYFVGRNGSIAHYNGSTWTKIESGTGVMLNSINGEPSGSETWISGYNPTGNHHSILLLVEGLTASVIWEAQNLVGTPPYGFNIQSIYLYNDLLFIASDEGIFRKNTRLDLSPQRLSSNPVWKYKITGTDQNDIYCVGDNSIITHYNGIKMKIIHQIFSNTSVFYSATAKNNTMASVGTVVIDVVYHKAQIVLTKRL
jgi:hypothetical protein